MEWLFSIIRIAGVAFPVSAMLVQLQAEIDNRHLSDRLRKFEDPLGHMHDDIPAVTKLIYEAIKIQNTETLNFEREFYTRYRRPLAMLESQGCIKGHHSTFEQFHAGLHITDPSFILYLAALHEDQANVQQMIAVVDSCEPGTWLNGVELASQHYLPQPVVKAVFKVYESKNLGLLSKEMGVINYVGQA